MNKDGEPKHISDELLSVARGIPRRSIDYPNQDIAAPTVDTAIGIVIKDLKAYLEHVTLETAE